MVFVQLFVPMLPLLLAETTGWDVAMEAVKTLAMIATGCFAYMASARAGRAETKAGDAEAGANAAKKHAESADKKAADTYHGISQVYKQTVAQNPVLKEIAQQTNGQLADRDKVIADLRDRLEKALAAQVPPAVAEALPKLAEGVDHIAAVIDVADKSGVFKAPQPRDPATRERKDDRPEGP